DDRIGHLDARRIERAQQDHLAWTHMWAAAAVLGVHLVHRPTDGQRREVEARIRRRTRGAAGEEERYEREESLDREPHPRSLRPIRCGVVAVVTRQVANSLRPRRRASAELQAGAIGPAGTCAAQRRSIRDVVTKTKLHAG